MFREIKESGRGSDVEGISSQISNVSNGISALKDHIDTHLKDETQSKDDIFNELKTELRSKDMVIENLTAELNARKKSQGLTCRDLDYERAFSRSLFTEISAIREDVKYLRDHSEVQDRRAKATSKQNDIRFKLLSRACGVKIRNENEQWLNVFQGDMRALLLSNFKSPQWLARLSLVNKSFHSFLNSPASYPIWTIVTRAVCGEEYMNPLPPGTPHADDERYMAKLRICPWLSVPRQMPPEHSGGTVFNPPDGLFNFVSNIHIGETWVTCQMDVRSIIGRETSEEHVRFRLLSRNQDIQRFASLEDHVDYSDFPGYKEFSIINKNDVIYQLKLNGRFPEELREDTVCNMDKIVCEAIHENAFAIYSNGRGSDVHIFSCDCKRLLRRIHIPRNNLNVVVRCKGPFLFVSSGYTIKCFGPNQGKKIELS